MSHTPLPQFFFLSSIVGQTFKIMLVKNNSRYIYIYIYGSVLVNEMPKSARYHIDRANSIVFTSKRLPLQPVSSERNHQVADKFRKVSCLNVYGRKRGRCERQTMHAFLPFLRLFIKCFFR